MFLSPETFSDLEDGPGPAFGPHCLPFLLHVLDCLMNSDENMDFIHYDTAQLFIIWKWKYAIKFGHWEGD